MSWYVVETSRNICKYKEENQKRKIVHLQEMANLLKILSVKSWKNIVLHYFALY